MFYSLLDIKRAARSLWKISSALLIEATHRTVHMGSYGPTLKVITENTAMTSYLETAEWCSETHQLFRQTKIRPTNHNRRWRDQQPTYWPQERVIWALMMRFPMRRFVAWHLALCPAKWVCEDVSSGTKGLESDVWYTILRLHTRSIALDVKLVCY